MTVKSTIDIDVNDEAFKKFHALFEKYKDALDKTPEAWAKQAKAALLMQRAVSEANKEQKERDEAERKRQKEIEEESKRFTLQSLKTAQGWKNVAAYTKQASSSILDATKSLLKWTGIGGIAATLIGGGGLVGLDRLANIVSEGRRASLGLGIGYGARRSFGVNFGRVIDSDTLLSGVNEALHDVTRRYTLYGAGLTEGDLRGKDTGQVSLALLQHLKQLVDKTPANLLGQVIQARGLGQFGSLQDFERLRATSPQELGGYFKNYGSDKTSFDLAQDTQRRWQDFSVQVTRAGQKIENVFVKGLEPLTPALTKLSDEAANAIQAFLGSKNLTVWIDKFGRGLESVADYLGSDKFQNDAKDFVSDIEALAHAVANALRWLGIIPRHQPNVDRDFSKDTDRLRKASPMLRYLLPQSPGDQPLRYPNSPLLRRPLGTNPGNLRLPGGSGFQQFKSADDGIRAMAHQLKLYQDRDHINTIRGIEGRYSPPNENDTHYLIRQLSARTGYSPDQPLNLNDAQTMAAIISGITKQEGSGNKYSKEVVIRILNNTGGNAIVSTAQLAH